MKKSKVIILSFLITMITGCTTNNSLSNSSVNSSSSNISSVINSESTSINVNSSSSISSEVNVTTNNSTSSSMIVNSSTSSSSSSSSIESSSTSTFISSSSTSSSTKPSSSSTSSSSTKPSSSSTVSSSTSSSSTKPSSSSTPSQVPNNLYKATLESNAPSYYESVRGLKGEELKKGLHKIIKGHTTFSYGSNINGYMKIYDKSYENSSKLNLIYTGEASMNVEFNKEHVWAKSHGDFGTGQGPGSDLHNLRPCYNNLNSTRGNLDFGEGGSEISSYPGNYKTSSTFEPRDDFKGDVARTIFYMATRYEGNEGSYPDLELEAPSDTKRYLNLASGAKGVHGDFDDLYKWATSGIDPVDNFEVNRNNIIYKDYQKNRNPFVDHPEFIIMIYDKNYNGPGALNDTNGSGETLEESVQRVEDLILSIGEVTLDSLEKIQEAEEAYNALSNEAKNMVDQEIYQKLLDARAKYNELYEANKVNIIIDLIDSIGEVTLASESLIKEIEKMYDALTSEQKSQVTNYQTLLDARAKLDELLKDTPKEPQTIYSGNFENVSGASSSYGSATLTLSSKSWYASKCYKQGSEFRLGHNKAATVESKFLNALNLSSLDGSSLEMQWDIENSKSITFTTNSNYGTVNKIYILKSLDQGKTYTKCVELDYSASVTTYTYEGDLESSARYALVISGSKPRLILTNVDIKGY